MFPIEPDDGTPGWAVGAGKPGERPIVGLGQCEEIDYPKLRALFEDGDAVPATFDEWATHATKLEATLTQEGYKVLRILVRPDELAAWCAAKGVSVNVRTCVDFVEAKVAKEQDA